MSNADRLQIELNNLLKEYGEESVLSAVSKWASSGDERSCTIVVNEGLHPFPDFLYTGEIFSFSKGFLNFSNSSDLENDLILNLKLLSDFLKKRKWKKVYLIISGHAVLNMYVKMAVYRVTRIDTIDWVYDGAGNYLKISIPMRKIMSYT
jgi:hypothetical protein